MSKLPENTEYTGAVGALVTCEIGGTKYAILQKRPQLFVEGKPTTLQVTVHGGLKENNHQKRAMMLHGLKRVVREEVSDVLERSSLRWPHRSMMGGLEEVVSWNINIPADLVDDRRRKLLLRSRGVLNTSRKTSVGDTTIRKTNVILGFSTTSENMRAYDQLIPEIQALQRDGSIVLLSKDDLDTLVPLDSKLHKEHGITEEGKYGMSADEIEAVKKALTQ